MSFSNSSILFYAVPSGFLVASAGLLAITSPGPSAGPQPFDRPALQSLHCALMTGPSFDLTYDEKSNVLRFDSGPFIAVKRVTSHDGTLQLLGVSDDYYLRLDFDEPASVTFGETSSVPQMALCQSGADQHGY